MLQPVSYPEYLMNVALELIKFLVTCVPSATRILCSNSISTLMESKFLDDRNLCFVLFTDVSPAIKTMPCA